MQHVLLEIYARLSDELLLKMAQVPDWREEIVHVLTGGGADDFFYRRTKHLVDMELKQRTNVDWKSIYYAVRARKEREEKGDKWPDYVSYEEADAATVELGLENKDTLLVMEEVYGPNQIQTYRQGTYNGNVLQLITNSVVLSHLIEEKRIQLTE